jgi:hypothetical protein
VREKSPRLLQHFNYEGKFVIGYVGTHGMAQRLETVVKAAKMLEQYPDIRFLFVGEGARRKALMKLAKRLNVSSIEFHGLVTSSTVVEYIALCDAIVVPLRKTLLFEGALPTKLFEAAAMERPIVLSAQGIAADLVQKYDAGMMIEPEDSSALAKAIMDLRNDPALRARYGSGGKTLASNFDRNKLADLMLDEIRRVLSASVA